MYACNTIIATVRYSGWQPCGESALSRPQRSPGRHLDGHWHKGYGGLRSEGEDLSDEEQRLHELKVKDSVQPYIKRLVVTAITGQYAI